MSNEDLSKRSVLAVCYDIGEVYVDSDEQGDSQNVSMTTVAPGEALDALKDCHRMDLVLVADVPGRDGTEMLIRRLTKTYPYISAVAVAHQPSVRRAVKIVQGGATDYVQGPLDATTLETIFTGNEDESNHDSRRQYFCDECPPAVEFVGQSHGAAEVLRTIRLVAGSRCEPVLILGESGVGKELAARAVHWWRFGDFSNFVAVNCATLKNNLLESELFGHVKGAFTGADKDSDGLLAAAAGGSIFLDEIGEMPPSLQTKLLRVIQEKSYRKVGGTKEIPCKARIIASTNRILLEAVEKGRFRHDLYYRLAVFPIVVPPLRDPNRRGDIPLLANYFVQNSHNPQSTISDGALQLLADHDWPGNVRELRNVIDRAAILAGDSPINYEHIIFDKHISQEPLATAASNTSGDDSCEDFSLEAAERELIIRALEETDGKRTQAAALLGITRATLHAKLKKYQINIPSRQNKKATSASSAK